MREEAAARGFRSEIVSWMPNPVDTAAFAPCGDAAERQRRRRQQGFAEGAAVVLYSGRLAAEKGLPCLLEGFAAAARLHPQAALVLLGAGPLQADLERQAAALGLGRAQVRFVGRVAPEVVPEWLQLADIFALTSPAEGFSCALAEAMASGLACLACDIPANRQLIHSGVNGLLVPAGDATAVAAAFGALVTGPGLRARLGLAARALIVARYTVDQVAEQYEQLFGEVLQARQTLTGRTAGREG